MINLSVENTNKESFISKIWGFNTIRLHKKIIKLS